MKKKRTWIVLGIVVVLVAAGGVYFATRQTANGQTGRNFLANAQTAKVIRTTLSNSVDSTGSLNPESRVPLSFGTSGTVAQVKVNVGDRVKHGDVLASLDTADLQLKVTQAEQAYLLQQMTYSNTVQADPRDIATAQSAYSSTLAAYNAAQQDYKNLATKSPQRPHRSRMSRRRSRPPWLRRCGTAAGRKCSCARAPPSCAR